MAQNFRRAPFTLFASCCITAALLTSCVKLPRRAASAGDQTSRPDLLLERGRLRPISLNRASREELEKLPGIGPALAERIVEHRTRYGPFRRVEHLLMVRGISDRRFREMRPHITAE